MIIPTKPEKARISIELTSAQIEAGEFTHDIDIKTLYENRNYCDYEFALVNGGQTISNAYNLFIYDGVLYVSVFFIGNDGSITKVTLSDGEGTITEVDGGSGELPAVTDVDDGKVLTVDNGAWSAENPATELPAVTNVDDGKVLMVSSGEWSAVSGIEPLPEVSSVDNGKVLGVVDGAWDVANPSGGLQLYAYAFTNSTPQSFNANSEEAVLLDTIYDRNDIQRQLPANPQGVVFLISGVSVEVAQMPILNFNPPSYGDSAWNNMSVGLHNLSGSTVTVNEGEAFAIVYSNVEFPLYEVE